MEKISERLYCCGRETLLEPKWDLAWPSGSLGWRSACPVADPVPQTSCFISPCTLFAEPVVGKERAKGLEEERKGDMELQTLSLWLAQQLWQQTQHNRTARNTSSHLQAKLYTYIRTEQKRPVATWAPRDARVQYSTLISAVTTTCKVDIVHRMWSEGVWAWAERAWEEPSH